MHEQKGTSNTGFKKIHLIAAANGEVKMLMGN